MEPVADAIGNVVVTVAVMDDGGLAATRSFNAMILRSSQIVLSEPFNYADGSITTSSGRLWTTRAGTPNQMQLTGGRVQVTSAQSEDVLAPLLGNPYDPGGARVLYASFDVTFVGLPAVAPDIFAHFSGVDSANLRGRVLASTVNAATGFYRLGVANTTSAQSNVVDYPLDLTLDTTYQVVISYDASAGSSKLWVNPASGSAPVDAIDARLPTPIASFGLRQSGGIGDMRIDNLLVGLSFEAVTPNITRVKIRRVGNAIEVYWPSAGVWEGFVLESTRSLAQPDWQPVSGNVSSADGWDVVTIPNPAGNEFFRLKRPF